MMADPNQMQMEMDPNGMDPNQMQIPMTEEQMQ